MRAIFWSWQISLAELCKVTHRLGHADARRSGSVAEKPRTVKRRFLFPIRPASEWTNWRISRVRPSARWLIQDHIRSDWKSNRHICVVSTDPAHEHQNAHAPRPSQLRSHEN